MALEAAAKPPADPLTPKLDDPSGTLLRGRSGQFAASSDFHTLLDGVAEVARSATKGDIQRAHLLSKGRWDRQRLFLHRLDLPLAETARQRLSRFAKEGTHVTWARVLDVALADTAERLLVLNRLKPANAQGVVDALALDDERAIRCVVQRLHKVPMETEYEVVARDIVAERNRRQYIVPVTLPNSTSLKQRHGGSWDATLADFGLKREKPEPLRGPAPDDVLDQFINEEGFLPTGSYLRHWAQVKGIRVIKPLTHCVYSELVATVGKRRAEKGWDTPSDDEMLSIKTGPVLPPPPPLREPYNEADRIAALKRYATEFLQPGQQPRIKHYAAVRREAGLMSVRALVRYDHFQELCRKAKVVP